MTAAGEAGLRCDQLDGERCRSKQLRSVIEAGFRDKLSPGGQRFAYDFVVTRGSDVFQGEGKKNEDHYCWDEPLYAPAAGRVVRAVGDVADNSPGMVSKTAPAPGNHVVIDHGHGAFSILAHFRLGSLAVRQGQHVSQGTLLGRCGNSGRIELPHVHYHLQTTPSYGEGEGLPLSFSGYFKGGIYISQGQPVRGEYLMPGQSEDRKAQRDRPGNQLTLEHKR